MSSAPQPLGTIAIHYSDTSTAVKSSTKLKYQVKKDLQAISTNWDCEYLKAEMIQPPGANIVCLTSSLPQIRKRLASFPELETPDKRKTLSHISRIVVGIENIEQYHKAQAVTRAGGIIGKGNVVVPMEIDNRPAKKQKIAHTYKRQSVTISPPPSNLKPLSEVEAATEDLEDFDSFINYYDDVPTQPRGISVDTEAIVERTSTGTEQGNSTVYTLIKDVQGKLEKADEERRCFEEMVRRRIMQLEEALKKERLACQATEELKAIIDNRDDLARELKRTKEKWDKVKNLVNSE
ncbi:hypothetical protein M422DRAFT_274978 [Sphaerobolus stellatus SS14]|uniref:Uncharacterized protein n=1 Tax=Sphaerobolus stellatus (strain SS14) TaxID=990650 RepID=A0A0C9UFP3_SPHS4|nr:hypothetical protein M422DRAFT_274978 [Sphaerobolus stellatus SS14]